MISMLMSDEVLSRLNSKDAKKDTNHYNKKCKPIGSYKGGVFYHKIT